MEQQLRVIIDIDNPDASDIAKLLQLLADFLKSATRDLLPDDADSVQWRITSLKSGSVIVDLVAIQASESEREWLHQIIADLQQIGTAVETGSVLSDETMLRLSHLLHFVRSSRQVAFLIPDNNEEARLTGSERAIVDRAERLSAMEFGSVRGTLTGISAQPDGLLFTLVDEVFNRSVLCDLPKELETSVKTLLGKRVEVRGDIKRDAEGFVHKVLHPVSIEEKPIRAFDLTSLIGVWPYDGRTSREILAEIRGE